MKISIWTGAAYEHWGPGNIEFGGIGGSETAAIHMARALAKLGHEVAMLGDHEGCEGDYHARAPATGKVPVRYIDYKRVMKDPGLLACDVLVSSRDKRVLRLQPKARAKVLWVHDVHVGDDWENEVDDFDLLYALTPWHKGYLESVYPHVLPEKIKVIRNGIDPERYEEIDWWDKSLDLVYSSSPDRGLDVILDLWPRLKEWRPSFKLHVCYGFENWRKLNAQNKRGLMVVDYMKARIDEMVDMGVVYHGRIGQNELARLQKKAALWAYPTAFSETYCITALEAQAAGSAVVTTKLAGLESTVGDRGLFILGLNKSAAYQTAFVDAIKAQVVAWEVARETTPPASEHPPVTEGVRRAREWAMTQTWESLAKEWEQDFGELLDLKGSSS